MGSIAPRKIALVDLKNQLRQTISEEYLNTELAFPFAVYSLKNKPGNIKIVSDTVDLNSIIDWGFK